MPYCYRYLMALVAALLCALSACRKDFDPVVSSGNLTFSKDTVFLDTVFANIGSSTYTLKVYNPGNEDINIPFIGLANGEQSNYRLNVDGLAGKQFQDIPLLAKDSLFVFIETTVGVENAGQTEFLYTDAIQFGSASNRQEVPLVTLVRDAVFLYPRTLANGTRESILLGLDAEGNEIRIEGFFLEPDELQFSNERPYVIYGYAAVPENEILNIAAGARIHFHNDSGILVSAGASLRANGQLSMNQDSLENEIIFEGDRLEPGFADAPGQWGTIWLAEGSQNSRFDHSTIKNATVGILAEANANDLTTTLALANTKIVNSATSNLWGRSATITAENTVLGNAGEVSLYCSLGGSYEFRHVTIANYWSNGFRTGPALWLSNTINGPASGQAEADLLKADFFNCIIDGNRSDELLLTDTETAAFNFRFVNSAITFMDPGGSFAEDPLYDFEDVTRYENTLLNAVLDYEDALNNDFRLLRTATVIDRGQLETALQIPLDILGNDRTQNPDMGAYEWVPQN